jgi:ABC-type branched-subunit amino acid transport system substrate-binding protein
MKRYGAIACLSVLGAVGCSDSKDSAAAITIGVVTSITGAGANPRNVQAINLAVEEINAAGGVNGSELKVEARDDTSTTDKAREVAQALIDLGVPAIIGPVNSTRFLAGAEKTVAAGRVQIGGAATSPAITSLDDNGFVFRTVPSDVNQGRLVAARAKAKGFTKVAIMHVNSVYGNGLADAFVSSFTEGGGTVTDNHTYTTFVESPPTSYASELSAIYANTPEAIFLIGETKASAQIIKDYVNAPPTPGVFWFFSDSQQNEFVTAAGASNFTFQHEGILSGTPQTTQYNSFKAAYKARYNEDPIGNVQNFYDATYLLALAMSAANSTNPTDIRDNLTKVSGPTGTLYGASAYSAAVADLKAGKDIDYDGASGNVDFDSNGDVVSGYAVAKVVGGQFVIDQPFVLP